MEFISMKCPECGAILDIEEGRKECFCSYCGNKVLVQNENEKTININKHITDDAEIVRANNEYNEEKRNSYLSAIVLVSFFIVLVIMIIFM